MKFSPTFPSSPGNIDFKTGKFSREFFSDEKNTSDETVVATTEVSKRNGKVLDRNSVDDQIMDLRVSVQGKIHGIEDVIAKDGKLAPKIPFIVPQPFDRRPYVSMNNGRRIAFYTHIDSILRSRKTEECNPVHNYQMKFWPHTETAMAPDNSQQLYDPHVNNFENMQKSREALYCELCERRLRLIICITCARGYCFFCAFSIHSDPSRRKHDMKIAEPKVEEVTVPSKSLIYHIDQARSVSHDLHYIVKYLRSEKEAKRLKEEQRMTQQYEQEEERKRNEFLKTELEATKVSPNL